MTMHIVGLLLLTSITLYAAAHPARRHYTHNAEEKLMIEELLEEIENMEEEEEERAAGPKRQIYANAVVYTVNPNDPKWHENPKEAIVIEGKKILFVGSTAEAEKYWRKGDDWYGMKWATILPGLHDVHQHPLESSSHVGATCTLDGTKSLEELGRYIKSSRCANGPEEWALGHGHDITMVLKHLKENGRNPVDILDEAVPNKPAVMMEATSHSVWVNSKALSRIGYNSASPNGPGGIIWKDKNGKPNGILLENLANVILTLALASNPINDKGNYDGLKDAMKMLSRNGITSVVDARAFWQRNHEKIWQKLLREEPDKFTVRAVLDLWAAPELIDDYQLAELAKRYSNDEDSLLRVNGIKVYIDGIIPSTTAAMKVPYLVNYGFPVIEKENKGINYFTQQRLTKYMKQLQNLGNNKGFDFLVHAIGDRGVHESLNAIEGSKVTESPDRPARHRLTHLEVVDPADYNRFKQLKAIADFQVAGDFTMPSQIKENEEFIGEKYKNFVPVNSIASTGAKCTLSSDWDVSPVNPFIGIQHAIQRQQQSVSLKKAIEMYTIDAAFVMRQEDKVGSLEAGKEADFIVINNNILDRQFDKNKIRRTKVLETVLQGKTVHYNY